MELEVSCCILVIQAEKNITIIKKDTVPIMDADMASKFVDEEYNFHCLPFAVQFLC